MFYEPSEEWTYLKALADYLYEGFFLEDMDMTSIQNFQKACKALFQGTLFTTCKVVKLEHILV